MNTHDQKPASTSTAVPLAIIGIGCLFPQSDNRTAFWSAIENGVDTITDIPETHWNTADYYDQDQKSPDRTYGNRGGFLSTIDFNPMEFNIPPNALEAIDTSQLLGLVAAGQALKDAGYGPEREYDRSRISVILGVTGTLELVIPLGARLGHPIWRKALKESGVEDSVAEDVVQRISDSYVPWQENSFPGLLGNVVAGRISKQFDLGGTNCVVDAACASSLSAVHLAAMELATGKSDMVITGGVDTFNDIFMYTCFSKTPALSPTGNARPFDSSADGTILGEGLGIVVLKRLSDAERNKDRIYAVIKGIGTSSDGKGDAIYAPSSAGQKKALLDAYQQAGVSPSDIGLLEAHGTGTKAGDVVEATALREVFGDARTPWCALGSVKSQIGHTKAAAGAAGLIKAAMALYRKVLPPTIKVSKPLDEVVNGATPFYMSSCKRPWLQRGNSPRRAAVSAFGFGGSNFHLVLEEYQAAPQSALWDGDVQIISLSGADAAALEASLSALPVDGNWDNLRAAADVSRKSFDSTAPCRLTLVVERKRTRLSAVLDSARTMLRKNAQSSWVTPEGVSFSCNSKPGKLGILFPGQGAQYTGMLRDIACRFPQMLETLANADRDFIPAEGALLSDLIYPASPFDDETKDRQEAFLRATQVAQPAIGAVSLGALKTLAGFGLTADAVAGHSYGELTALCAAGRIDETSLHLLSRLRGRLMAAGSGNDPGSMLAVSAPLADVEKLLVDEQLDLVIANRNAPTQSVLSGSSAETARAITACAARGLTAKQLPVAAAFHSALVAEAAEPFLTALDKIELKAGTIPVYANSTANCYPADSQAAKELLGNQLARPVEFVAQIEAMYAEGVRTFVEVGPGARLTGLVSAILGEREHAAMSLDSSSGKRSGIVDLARLLARLAVLGYDLQLTRWDEEYQPPAVNAKKPAMTIPICGANYMKPRPKRPPVENQGQKNKGQGSGGNGQEKANAFDSTLAPAVSRDALAESLRVTREGMSVLQKMQEETAQLHRRFLEGQETATRTIQTLLAQQQQVLQGPGARGQGPVKAFNSTPDPGPRPPAPAFVSLDPGPRTLDPVLVSPAPVVETLLSVVAEKTGYPVEMLELDMGMDSDLGIDSIKRVEILSALQERLPGSPVIGPEQLGTLRTLGDIAVYLQGQGSGVNGQEKANDCDSTLAPVSETLLSVVAEKTGYPVEMLELDMGMDSDLGIDSIKRVEILSALQERLPGSPVIGPEQLGTLRTLGDIAVYLQGQGSGVKGQEKANDCDSTLAPCPLPLAPVSLVNRSAITPSPLPVETEAVAVSLDGEIWVTNDASPFSEKLCSLLRSAGRTVRLVDIEEAAESTTKVDIAGLVIVAPSTASDDQFLENAFLLLKSAAPNLRRSAATGKGALFTTISRLDGFFGFGERTMLADPLSGGLAGLAKTASREWSDVFCKAIDLGGFEDHTSAAKAVAAELFCSGPVEVGLNPQGRFMLDLTDLPTLQAPEIAPINTGDVVVVTGGGRGVTTAAVVALAEAFKPLLVLLGRSSELMPEPAWLELLTDESMIKRGILEHATGKLHPREIEEQYRTILAGRELRSTLARVEAAGGQAIYRSVDIRDSEAISALMQDIRQEYGPIRGIVHGAGVLADRLITDKTSEQFALVYGTKVSGLRTLLDATSDDHLRFIALFGSTTGRFGRKGQVDYAVANEVLNKLAQAESRRRPGCRVVSFNWGPWDGGMVTPNLKKVFADEGIGLISLLDGGELLIREIASGKGPVEVVAMAGAAGKPLAVPGPAAAKPLSCALNLNLSVEDFPFLKSHVMDAHAVLPMAMIMEWLSHGALHGNPGLHFHGFNDLRICKGVIMEPNQTLGLQVMAGRAEKRDSLYVVPVELTGAAGHDQRTVLHARGEVVLAKQLPEGIRSIPDPPAAPYAPLNNRLYDPQRLFHGPDLQGIRQVESCYPKGIAALVNAAPQPSRWIRQPLRSSWLSDPLVMDCAFQLMILWSFHRFGAASLPCFVGRYRQYHDTFPRDGAQIIIRVTAEREHGATADVEFLDSHTGKLVARLEDYECVIDPSLERAFQRNRLPDENEQDASGRHVA